MKYTTEFIIFAISSLTITLTLADSQSSEVIVSGFDEPCNNATLQCKRQSWLTCDQVTAKCRCYQLDGMIYSNITNKCVAQIGKRCQFGSDNGTELTEVWDNRAGCEEGSLCSSLGICVCPEGYGVENNKCVLIKLHGKSCRSNKECSEEQHLICIVGKCLCDPAASIYNKNSFLGLFYDIDEPVTIPGGICISRIGTKCSPYTSPPQPCTRNAFCDRFEGSTCQCMHNYMETSDGLCGLGYNQPCSDTNVCTDKLRCINFTQEEVPVTVSPDESDAIQPPPYHRVRCACPYQEYQIFDENTCRGLVGARCDPNVNLSCFDKAVCMKNDTTFQCGCHTGYVGTLDHKCDIGFGGPCDYEVEGLFSDDSIMQCDRKAKLVCKGRQCSCVNEGDLYEPDTRRCISPVEIECTETSEGLTNPECITNKSSKIPGATFFMSIIPWGLGFFG